jgi:signal transduction histidine kinase
MYAKLDNFFTSGWSFDESETDTRSKFQMINVALVLSTLALFYGIAGNILRETYHIVPIEAFLASVNVALFFILKKYRKSFTKVATIITFQFTFFFLYLAYAHEPSDLKHVWLFTYPIILLYLQSKKAAMYWFGVLIALLIIAPLQPFVDVSYSLYQVTYIAFVLLILASIVYFYQLKMEEAKALIRRQQTMLQHQAKQAVMGEMISMIAHQWRQPLSTVTLNVSNLQIKKLLGKDIPNEEFDKALEDISDTVVYLSDTIDDFQTYFRPNKEITRLEIRELIERSVSFALPRLKGTNIKIEVDSENKIIVETYANELVQVMLNIITNAIDALAVSDNPKPQISIRAQERDDKIAIFIKDDAGGISDKSLPRVFEPYFSTKGKNGTGLGLYMSQMIVQKQFNGVIKVQSSPKGTQFEVEIQKELS